MWLLQGLRSLVLQPRCRLQSQSSSHCLLLVLTLPARLAVQHLLLEHQSQSQRWMPLLSSRQSQKLVQSCRLQVLLVLS